MNYQLCILSEDAIFARMLELEFQMLGLSVFVSDCTDADVEGQVTLIDLDNLLPPIASARYGRMIGFTRNFTISSMDSGRRCSMVLHRPFEMRLLREEVLKSIVQKTTAATVAAVQAERPLGGKTQRRVECMRVDELPKSGFSPKERAVLDCLYRHRGEVVSRETLATVLGSSDSNQVEVYICFLRRKLARFSELPLIRTVRGKGYLLVDRPLSGCLL